MAQEHTIVDLSIHRKTRNPVGKELLEAYWREIGGVGDVPFRDSIDPARIASCLGDILLIERIAPGQARIRLSGQNVSRSLGFDPRGMPLTSFVTAASRSRLEGVVETLFDEPARVELSLAGPKTAFRKRLEGEMLFLPLRDREGQITRAIAFAGLPDRRTSAPLRFEIMETRHSKVAAKVLAPRPAPEPDFEVADRAREALRRREGFRIVTPA